MSEKYDKNGQLIGDGSWHMSYNVQEFPGLPIRHTVEEACGSESVYVSYQNTETLKSAKVRFSTHHSNSDRYGETIVGGTMNERNEILTRLGFMRKVWRPNREKYIERECVGKKRIADFEVADKTMSELLALPEGSDISEYCRKIAKDSNFLIKSIEVKVIESRFGRYIYEEI